RQPAWLLCEPRMGVCGDFRERGAALGRELAHLLAQAVDGALVDLEGVGDLGNGCSVAEHFDSHRSRLAREFGYCGHASTPDVQMRRVAIRAYAPVAKTVPRSGAVCQDLTLPPGRVVGSKTVARGARSEIPRAGRYRPALGLVISYHPNGSPPSAAGR